MALQHALTALVFFAAIDSAAALSLKSVDRSAPALATRGPFAWMRGIFHRSNSGPGVPEAEPVVKDTAKVEIYYETQCPACLQLLNVSLREAFEDKALSKRTEFNLYPFGNALMLSPDDVSEGYHFWHEDASDNTIFMCQHGDEECLGNMIQACTIDLLHEPSKYVPYTLCMASYGFNAGIEKSSYECGEELDIDMDAVKACAQSRTGDKLMVEIGKTSDSPDLQRDHVPFVMINGVHHPAADEGELITSICKSISDPLPKICAKATGTHTEGCAGGGTC